MSEMVISGKRSLHGEIVIQGSKNAVLPIMAASLLICGTTRLRNAPQITDVDDMCSVLEKLGCVCVRSGHVLDIDASSASPRNIEACLSGKMRSSVFILGPLLARFGEANIHMPGGCVIGKRPIDLHLYGLRALGAVIHERPDGISALSLGLRGTRISLSYPSVGATENILMAAVLAGGITVIEGCAAEPEVISLCMFLNSCGARIDGIGTSTLVIHGTDARCLHAVSFDIDGDRIAAATYLYACAGCMGEVGVRGVRPLYLQSVLVHLRKLGCRIKTYDDCIYIEAKERPRITGFGTRPYPGFPTDIQPIALAAMTCGIGSASVCENVFEDRFGSAILLKKFGASLKIENKSAIITGVDSLHGACAAAADLRGGAALVIAGLMGKGQSRISGLEYLDRGYETPEKYFADLGADIARLDLRKGSVCIV